jgi:hypothetical protein
VIESFFAPVAQLDRALVFGTKGWRFKSSQVRHFFGCLPQPRCSDDFDIIFSDADG